MKIKKIKISYKGQGIDASDMAKDLSSIGLVRRRPFFQSPAASQ